MHPELKAFAQQVLRVVVITLVPVVFTAFVSLPWALGGHPGEPAVATSGLARHMT